MRTILTFLIALLLNQVAFAQSGVFYNVKDFGAKGDGQAIDTQAIDAAINAASEKGGGTVFFPAGTYLSFTIHLKSFITLNLDNGAVLEAADVKKYGPGYDPAEPNATDMYQDFGHSHWRNSLIYGENLQNVAITGLGTIFGNGLTREGDRTPGIETVDGGILEDVTIDNIVMKDIQNAPFFLRLGARMRGPKGTPVGVIRRINISNVVVYSENPKFCTMIAGIPGHPVEDVKMNNIMIRIRGGAPKEQALARVAEHETSYPDPQEFGAMPAYGFYIRHAKNIELNHVEMRLENDDFRPAIILDDVNGISLDHVTMDKVTTVPPVVLKNVEDIRIKDCSPIKDGQIKKITSKQL